MLKEIKTQYENKCKKCDRDIKKGWIAYVNMDATPKEIFCKPCGQELNKLEESKEKVGEQPVSGVERLMDMIGELASTLNFQGDLLAQIEENLRDMHRDIASIDNRVRDAIKPAVEKEPEIKKETKTKK